MSSLAPDSVFTSSSGFKMPVIGLGTANDVEAFETGLNTALEAGYRLLDTAYVYRNEEIIGKVLKEWFTSGKLKRKDIVVTTKLTPQANRPKDVREFLEKSLKALQLEFVDLFLIHHPVGLLPGGSDFTKMEVDMSTDLEALWKEMEKQVDAGLTKAIGVSNFNNSQLERILKVARIPPANQEIELYLYNQDKSARDLCRKNGIIVTSFSTLGSPGAVQAYRSSFDMNPMEAPEVLRIAKAHGKTPAQILLRHMIQLGVTVIPKSAKPERIRQNIQVFDFHLSEDEMKELNNLDKGEEGRLFDFKFLRSHPEYPY